MPFLKIIEGGELEYHEQKTLNYSTAALQYCIVNNPFWQKKVSAARNIEELKEIASNMPLKDWDIKLNEVDFFELAEII